MTPQQLELKRAHGTVEEFTDAVINAIGEISVAEAQQAIASYRAQWAAAGHTDIPVQYVKPEDLHDKSPDCRACIAVVPATFSMKPVAYEAGVTYYSCQHYPPDALRRYPCDQGCK